MAYFTRRVLLKVPRYVPLFIFFDASVLNQKELTALVALGQIAVRSILAACTEILEEFGQRHVYLSHKSGSAVMVASDAASRTIVDLDTLIGDLD